MNVDTALDYCDYWFDVIRTVSIKACCFGHDIAYLTGGTILDRLNADQALSTCVDGTLAADTATVALAGIVSLVMLIGTRALGWLFWPKAKREERTPD